MVDPSFGLGKLIYIMLHQYLFSIVMPNYSGEYALSSFTTIGHLHHFCLLPIIIYEKSIHLQIIPMLKSLQWILAKDSTTCTNTSFSTYQLPYKPPFSSIKCPVFRPIFWRLERMCSTRMSWPPSCSGIETESGRWIHGDNLVVWNMAAMTFQSVGNNHTDFNIFQRGRYTTNQIMIHYKTMSKFRL